MGHKNSRIRKWRTRSRIVAIEHPFYTCGLYTITCAVFIIAAAFLFSGINPGANPETFNILRIAVAIGIVIGTLIVGIALAKEYKDPIRYHKKITRGLGLILLYLLGTCLIGLSMFAIGFLQRDADIFLIATQLCGLVIFLGGIIGILILLELAFSGWMAHFRNQPQKEDTA